ncbi:CG12096 [Drosophila busckii]|uniref:26S proteasome non-ATPase regulatory subunit 5 n=1 Tax=Drosophila busckii TaxID=30019 RepID=A0A0M3QZ53_DROBS|nr:26S proteasome non-ATPase regulatory subunit 5 [Drosophila busckii]ALC48769.1 CG12096 [Drosophila busckii]
MDEDWWLEQLQQLKMNEKRLDVLTNMYTTINKQGALPRQILEKLLREPLIYECALIENAAKEPLVNLTIDFIGSCLEQLQLDMSDEKLPKLLQLTLNHSNPAVRALVLKQLQRQAGKPSQELLLYVLDELQQPETLSSTAAINILAKALVEPELKNASVQSKLLQLLKQNEVVRCRAYELGVKLAKSSAATLSAVEFILDAALSELDNDDVLLQASVMEILVPLAEQNHGLSYMERRRVFDIFSSRVQRLEEHPLDALLIPSIMKFFGKIAAVQPQKILTGYPHMLLQLFELLQSGDETVLPTAMDTLANLAGSNTGKILLHKQYETQMLQALSKFATYTKHLSPLLKVRLLNALDMIYARESSNSAEVELSNILKLWFESFAGGQQLDHIMELLHTPFPDLQLAALALMKTLCLYDWGILSLKNTGGAVEFLLSRQRDLHKDVKYVKWQILEQLCASDKFAPSEILRFTAYVNEGPYYVQADVSIATEPQ